MRTDIVFLPSVLLLYLSYNSVCTLYSAHCTYIIIVNRVVLTSSHHPTDCPASSASAAHHVVCAHHGRSASPDRAANLVGKASVADFFQGLDQVLVFVQRMCVGRTSGTMFVLCVQVVTHFIYYSVCPRSSDPFL